MPKAKTRDGVFQRKDRSGWWISYTDANGRRCKEKKLASHTRTQALDELHSAQARVALDKRLGVKAASEITTEDLLTRYKRHQKARLRPTTFERFGGILKTLNGNLPERAKDITRRSVAEYIETRSETVKPGTVAKEMSVLKHCLKLAVEWELLHHNPALGARLPKLPAGRTKYLTPGEFRAALEAAPQMDARANGLRRLHWRPARRDALASMDGRGYGKSATLPPGD